MTILKLEPNKYKQKVRSLWKGAGKQKAREWIKSVRVLFVFSTTSIVINWQ